jgi:hypothetical protein
VQGFSIFARNKQFIGLVIVLVLSSLTNAQGSVDVELQYLITVFGFQQADFSKLYCIFGLGGFLVLVRCCPLLSILCKQCE